MNILEAIIDPQIFSRWFCDRDSWEAWFAFLAALFHLPMTADWLEIYQQCTGRREPPDAPVNEAWLVVGRRGGKSFIVAVIAVFLATFRDYAKYLAPGEVGTVVVIAADRRQARTILRYVTALLEGIPMLRRLIVRKGTEGVELANQITIEIHTASFRAVRGYTIVAALCDEIAFWRADESANPDHEILNAVRPAMSTIPGSVLLCLSSPYARRGAMWEAYRRHYSKDGPILIWQADTRTMNPTVPQRLIDAAYERDQASAAAEYGAAFRTDVESFVTRGIVESCIIPDRFELPPQSGVRYHAFVDPSGGSQDSMTLAISHRTKDSVIVLDAVREVRPPFSPDSVVQEFSQLLRAYHLHECIGDRYAGAWPAERFSQYGIQYTSCAQPKSDIYRDALPLLNSGMVELLDHEHLANQLIGLERRTARGGKDSIDHAPHGHDDVANAVAGALTLAAAKRENRLVVRSLFDGREVHQDDIFYNWGI